MNLVLTLKVGQNVTMIHQQLKKKEETRLLIKQPSMKNMPKLYRQRKLLHWRILLNKLKENLMRGITLNLNLNTSNS